MSFGIYNDDVIYYRINANVDTFIILAHRSQILEWAIVITHCPSSVRPSSSVPKLSHFNLFSRTAWWILMNFGRDEVLMVPYKFCCFSARSAQGRNQGDAKIGHWGPLQETSSSDRKATATNQMHKNNIEACGKKCCYFLFHFEVKSMTRLTSLWTWFCLI